MNIEFSWWIVAYQVFGVPALLITGGMLLQALQTMLSGRMSMILWSSRISHWNCPGKLESWNKESFVNNIYIGAVFPSHRFLLLQLMDFAFSSHFVFAPISKLFSGLWLGKATHIIILQGAILYLKSMYALKMYNILIILCLLLL